MTVHDYSARTIDGEEQEAIRLQGQGPADRQHREQVRLHAAIRGLEALFRKYRDRGLVVLGFPCDQFGHQEPGDENEIKTFCSLNYGVSFPMFAKVDVNGAQAHPLYNTSRARHPGFSAADDQVELHEVPGRQVGQGRKTLRIDRQAGVHCQRRREALVAARDTGVIC